MSKCQQLIDISGEYSGWETVSDRLQKCCESGKCWGYSKSKVVDFTKQFEDAVVYNITFFKDAF